MEVIRMIVFGFVIGVIARFLMPGPQPMGIIFTTLLGVAGSFLGGYLGHLLHGSEEMSYMQPAGWIGSIIGAALLLFVAGFLKKKNTV